MVVLVVIVFDTDLKYLGYMNHEGPRQQSIKEGGSQLLPVSSQDMSIMHSHIVLLSRLFA